MNLNDYYLAALEGKVMFGMDGSHWASRLKVPEMMVNGYGRWNQIPKWGIWKATDGLYVINNAGKKIMWYDDTYEDYSAAIQAAGIPDGSFHYYREPVSKWIPDPETQAKEYYNFVSSFPSTAFPPILDLERINNPYLKAQNVWTCLYHIERLFKRKPWIYTGYYIWRDMLKGPSWGSNYQLWIARYADTFLTPTPWTAPLIWQYGDAFGDENFFMGDADALANVCEDRHIIIQVPIDIVTPTIPSIIKDVTNYIQQKSYFTKKQKLMKAKEQRRLQHMAFLARLKLRKQKGKQ